MIVYHKKLVTKLIHCLYMYQLATSSKCLFTRLFIITHEVEAMVIASQMKITRKQIASSSVEPAHNGKISMHTPLSNAIKLLSFYCIQENNKKNFLLELLFIMYARGGRGGR